MISSKYIGAFVGFLAGAITIYTFSKSEITSIFGKDSDELRVIEAHLYAQHGFFDPRLKDFIETVKVKLEVRNFGDQKIKLTSADAEIIHSQVLKFATSSQGNGILGCEPEKNNAISIKPGETKSIILSEGIKLEGITPFLESPEFKNEYYSGFGGGYILHDLSWIDRLNKEFALRYGKDAAISISLHEKYKKPIKNHVINFSSGSDTFNHLGVFQHDRFLGAVRNLQQNLRSN